MSSLKRYTNSLRVVIRSGVTEESGPRAVLQGMIKGSEKKNIDLCVLNHWKSMIINMNYVLVRLSADGWRN